MKAAAYTLAKFQPLFQQEIICLEVNSRYRRFLVKAAGFVLSYGSNAELLNIRTAFLGNFIV